MTWQPPDEVVILSGGNPQVPKGDGDAPVRYFLQHMPDWQRPIGEALDRLILEVVPDARKAVRWNSPFYGSRDAGWFLNVHCFAKHVKVTFFDGALLEPPPSEHGKDPKVRWVDVGPEGLDEVQMRAWIEQAARLPGWDGS